VSRRLLLIRHSIPEVDPDVPAPRWHLGERGRAAAAAFAERLRPYDVRHIATSREPKASETAEILADRLGVTWAVEEGLHEHERSRVPFFADLEEFYRRAAELFARPDETVFGDESADAARARFGAAVERVLAAHPGGDVAVVAHGTIITLHARPSDPFPFWRALKMPDLVELTA
jgi:broad specificity phosphatase PhoE